MKSARWFKHTLIFDRPRGTSRGSFTEKPSWFISISTQNGRFGIGECGLLPGLSVDHREGYEEMLDRVVEAINHDKPRPDLAGWPSIRFGLEMALAHLESGDLNQLIANPVSIGRESIPINGLVWMGNHAAMKAQIVEKIDQGFTTIKLKIGAIDFDEELNLLAGIRETFSKNDITIRVDANGAFAPTDAMAKLNSLAAYDIHSIEQPIKQGQWDEMAKLCETTPIDIALDEELIGIETSAERRKLIETIKPQAIILKPSLVGGWKDSNEWIDLAESTGAYWWMTSALESNIGLNAIAQYTAFKKADIPQGLGTGMLYTNNIDSPMVIEQGHLKYLSGKPWQLPNQWTS